MAPRRRRRHLVLGGVDALLEPVAPGGPQVLQERLVVHRAASSPSHYPVAMQASTVRFGWFLGRHLGTPPGAAWAGPDLVGPRLLGTARSKEVLVGVVQSILLSLGLVAGAVLFLAMYARGFRLRR